MKVTVLSLFPGILESYFSSSIMAKAIERGIMEVELVNIRDFAADRHRTCDDAPYGGGPGMVMKAEPIAAALDSVACEGPNTGGRRTIFPTPSGRLFTQRIAESLAGEEHLVFICGRYEGIDQRIIDLYVDDELSIGDYVLSSGEIASLAIIDAVYRLVDGVIRGESLIEESHSSGLLEYPHYTRPEVFRGLRVPEVLLSGHHGEIERWRTERKREKTMAVRPDLLAGSERTPETESEERDGRNKGD